ncbi:hypothetical protein LTR85_006506 [Meristemomyces frigidus]|nr:hypothetical protein LTR85_006506 [Meristemomyces frigidus]
MHPVKLFAVAAVAVSAAPLATLVSRDAPIAHDLGIINDDTVNLKAKIDEYDGGKLDAIPVKNAGKKLGKHIKSGTGNIENASPISSADSQGVIDYINNTLEPNLNEAMSALGAKEHKIAKADLKGSVKKQLCASKSKADALGAGLVAKIAADKQGAAQAAVAKVDADLGDAAQRFS